MGCKGLCRALLGRRPRDPLGDRGVRPAQLRDRAFFAPDGLYLEVVAVTSGSVTARVTAPRDAPEFGEERTVSLADWRGMFDEGTLRALPDSPRLGEVWADRNSSVFCVAEVREGMAVFEDSRKRLQAATGNGNNAKTNYLWDTSYGLPQLALEQSGNGKLVRRYTTGLDTISMATSASSVYYYSHDPLGSVRDVTDANGTPVANYDYEPYGTIRTQTGSLDNPLTYAGQYLDPTGLYHLRARQYDPAGGRFLSNDPAGQAAEGKISSYLYADDRPTIMVDPSGATFRSEGVGLLAAGNASSKTKLCRAGLFVVLCTVQSGGDVIDLPHPPSIPRPGVSTAALTIGAAIGLALESCRRSNCLRDDTKWDRHHIVAVRDRRAAESRRILWRVGMTTQDEANLVDLPRWFHARLHTTLYHLAVQLRLGTAAGPLDASQTRYLIVGAGNRVRRELIEIGVELRLGALSPP
jgi:RHS repeat-associated protein